MACRDPPFMDPNYFKDRFGTEGKSVLLTFGLLSPNKGIENVIRALPAILKKHPNVGVYRFRCDPSAYPATRRRALQGRVAVRLQRSLAFHANVIFANRFVSAEETDRARGRRGYLHYAVPA